MSIIRAVSKILPVSGLLRDAVQNAFVFAADDLAAATLTSITNAVVNFFNSKATNQTQEVMKYMSNDLARTANAGTVQLYDISGHLDGTPAGSPIQQTLWTPAGVPDNIASGFTDLPEEVAAVLSYHGDLTGIPIQGLGGQAIPTPDRAVDEGAPATHVGSTRPAARLKGRLFIGPLNSVCAFGTDDAGAAFRANLGAAAQGLIGASSAAGHPVWSVWSRRNAAVQHVTGGGIVDVFGSQRRRRPRATVKTPIG